MNIVAAQTHAPAGKPEVTTDTSRTSPLRPRAKGKFLFVGDQKFYVRGVTYGPFRPEPDGSEYHTPGLVERDFAQMQRHGVNALRTYTLPPRWLLDLASQFDLRVLVGLSWEQHITFLRDRGRALNIERRIRAGVNNCAGHPAVLGYAIGNEIPSPLVRWYGHRRIEHFLERLYRADKAEDPDGLVTYVNYPSTEYLELPFVDFTAFNVYLESSERFEAYLARLQNMTGDRPLLMGEIGLDSLRHGESRQAKLLQSQGHSIFEAGCAGLFFFSWTDEWYHGGHEIEDWKFGVTTASREPKPALANISTVFHDVPFPASRCWPSFSVVVCTYNGSRTLGSCLQALQQIEYPDFEVIVVDDGSIDHTATLAAQFNVRLVRIPSGGLSHARNIGWKVAKGDLVAYLDDDAAPDKHWLLYLALGFQSADYAGVGGPNIAWPNSGWLADCVEHAPGNPTHVLLTDREAEHLPGCNMAFRKKCLEAVGGFDKQFRIAGDDVDLCWRLQDRGWRLGFHPAAMVWHRRRDTLRDYWQQQLNYGKAEAMLERKWPEKYNLVGHATWNGRLYSKGLFSWLSWSQRRIYHGTWGSALFQSIYNTAPGTLASILMLPEWYLVIAVLGVISLCGLLYPPLRYCLVLLALAFIPPVIHAVVNGARAFYRISPYSALAHFRLVAGTAFLHFLQPAARLWGRLCFGLTPWRRRGYGKLTVPWPQNLDIWSELHWLSAEQRLKLFEEALRGVGAGVTRGGDYDRWDLQVRAGLLGAARFLLVTEEHGNGKQYVRIKLWPVAHALPLVVACLFALLASIAALDLRWTAWALLNIPAIFLLGRTLYECAGAMAILRHVITTTKVPFSQDQQPLKVQLPAQDSKTAQAESCR
jgi:cellulose synthase/poly-beta-1,6-N-acetylglucosamine synthase-like glycosyltransferase